MAWRSAAAGFLVLWTAACGGDGDTSGDPAPPDASRADAGPADGGAHDATSADARRPDAAPTDDGVPDARASTDAFTTDGFGSDARLEDNFGVVETAGRADCENLLASACEGEACPPAPHCLVPFPSDTFLVRDGDRRRFRFGATSLPARQNRRHLDPAMLADFDGWGPATPVMVEWRGATLTGLPPVFDPAASLEPAARTLILDAESGERVPHWAEFDHLTLDQPVPVLVLRPAVPFRRDRRFVVAFRGVRDANGDLLPAPDGFAALRDRTASRVVGVHARRAHFESSVFPVLEAAGVARAELQLAWDFTTATDAILDTPLAARDAILQAIGADGPEYRVDQIDDAPGDEHVALVVDGTAFIPSVLVPGNPGNPRRLRLADGRPRVEGVEEVRFRVQVPRSALEGGPAAVIQYGHGFLGTKEEADNGWLRAFADRHRFLILSADMQGMSTYEAPMWASALTRDPSVFPVLSEAPLQGVMNHLALVRMMKGRFLREPDPRLAHEGRPLYDPSRVYYYGNSQGGTMGTLITALSTDLERGVLGVPGCGYPFLLQRSTVFQQWTRLLDNLVDTRTDLALVLALLGTGFDRLDPLTYAPHVVHDPFPNTRSHQVLLHVAREDAQVHNQVSFILGRTIDVPLMVPAVRPVWGLVEQTYPHRGSALVEYDFNVPHGDPLLPPSDETDTHASLRRQREGQDQMMHFLETGELRNFCDGACSFPGRP